MSPHWTPTRTIPPLRISHDVSQQIDHVMPCIQLQLLLCRYYCSLVGRSYFCVLLACLIAGLWRSWIQTTRDMYAVLQTRTHVTLSTQASTLNRADNCFQKGFVRPFACVSELGSCQFQLLRERASSRSASANQQVQCIQLLDNKVKLTLPNPTERARECLQDSVLVAMARPHK
jgi:hypothetical protein